MRIRGNRPLTAVQQLVNLRCNPICCGRGQARMGKLVWQFEAQPDILSRNYSARISYREGNAPRIYIIEPDLTLLAEGRRIPHVYEQKPTRLCLYLPGAGEWSPSKRISETIVPWTFLWLWYFEEWLASGEWKGGGKHPSSSPRKLDAGVGCRGPCSLHGVTLKPSVSAEFHPSLVRSPRVEASVAL